MRTGPFLSMSGTKTRVQQSCGFPPRLMATQHCQVHFFIVLPFPPGLSLPPPAARGVLLFLGRSFLQDVAQAAVTSLFPRSPALPSEELLAHGCGQEGNAARPRRARAKSGRALLVFPLSYQGFTWKRLHLLWSMCKPRINK